MPYSENEILTFINEPLPPNVLQALMNSIEAYGALKGLMLLDNTELIEQLLLIRELRYVNAISKKDFSHEDVLLALSFNDVKNEICQQVYTYEKCMSYIADRLLIHPIIPATDLLRIDYYLKNHTPTVLTDSYFTDAYDSLSKRINDDILKIFYGLNNRCHSLIRMAVAYYLFDLKLSNHKFNILALDILFSTLVHDEQRLPQVPIWLSKYALLNIDWGYVSSDGSFEIALIKFLNYLKDEFQCICFMLRDKKNKTDNIVERLQHVLPKIYTESLSKLICNNLCLRNSDFVDALNITHKTAIKYIKMLETEKLVKGIKRGREKIYINQELISLIRE